MTAAMPTYALDVPLPEAMATDSRLPWTRYRRFPVFSLRWVLGRGAVFAAALLGLTALIGFGTGVIGQSVRVGVLVTLLEFVAFWLMAMLGPLLAAWVRHCRWPLARERGAVVVALLVGMVLSFFIDRLASGHIGELVSPVRAAMGAGQLPHLGPMARALSLAVNAVLLIVVYGLFGGGLALRAYFSEQRRWDHHHARVALDAATAQARDADLRLGVLQAQVEPHFLFNTLASVRALVRQDPAQAEATLDALVDFLRATIPRLRDGQAVLHSTLGEQLDLCARYLALMQLRMGGRLQYAVRADDMLRAQPFPPSLLITLVENAIKHGIEPKPGHGRVDVIASLAHGLLWVQVCDDGLGLREGAGGGMGLANVRQQLAARFDDRAVLRLRALEGGGVCAEVGLPVQAS